MRKNRNNTPRSSQLVLFGGLLLASMAATGCLPENLTGYDYKSLQPPPTESVDKGYIPVGQQVSGDLTVDLSIYNGAHTGYNHVQFTIESAALGGPISNATVEIKGTMFDSEGLLPPRETPATDVEFSSDVAPVYAGGLFFLPPAPGAGDFTLDLFVSLPGGDRHELSFDLDVEESIWMQRIEDANGPLYVSWVDPMKPVVGVNEFVVALHRDAGYELVSDASLDLFPYMDMGAGEGHSTPYEAPVFSAGQYRGTVNFIMAGGWDMTVFVDGAGLPRSEARFPGYTVFQP